MPNAVYRDLRREAEMLPPFRSSYQDCTGDIYAMKEDTGMSVVEAIAYGAVMMGLGFLAGKYGR